MFAAFAGRKGSTKPLRNVPRTRDAMIEFLTRHGNDLSQAAIACAPVISEVLIALRALPGVRLVRMSGSGPTCFALFGSAGEAEAAAAPSSGRAQGLVGPFHTVGMMPLKLPLLPASLKFAWRPT